MKKSLGLTLALTTILTVGCASTGVRRTGGLLEGTKTGGVLAGTTSKIRTNGQEANIGNEIIGVPLEVTTFDIPVVKNSRVEFWVKFFSGRGRNVFAEYIHRLGRMSPLMVPKLREAGLPEDLVYLAMIESGFSSIAKSWAGAVGPWQFMRATGRMYGLNSDVWRDERRDPVKSTDAAIRHLAKLYAEFQDWELAAAAYNAGEGRIRRGIAKYNTRDYWELARKRAIRPETVDYVPKMMAAAIITKNAKAFGFTPPEMDPYWLETTKVNLNFPEDLYTIARVAGVEHREIRMLNPELSHWTTPPVRGYSLRLPNEVSRVRVAEAIDRGELGKYSGFKRYVVRRGDTVSGVASRFNVGTQPILALNNLANVRALRPGQALVLPIPRDMTPVVQTAAAPRREPARILPARKAKPHVAYRVQAGDTLYDISRRYDVSVRELKEWNSISGPKTLRPGRVLRLYVRNDKSSI